jgi:(p)ppGpp synthase/HD superfamily hydrolase
MGTFIEMPQAIGTSEVVRDAYELLVSKHAGQRQKVNGHPYVEHPILVASDVGEAGFDSEMIAAALLHDIVEDSDMEIGEVRESFGERVGGLVEAMTDEVEVEPYERRKSIHRHQILEAGPEAAVIFAADKLNNVRALRSAYGEEGEEVARRFKQPLDTKLRVWISDVEFVSEFSETAPFAADLKGEVDALEADRLRARRAS